MGSRQSSLCSGDECSGWRDCVHPRRAALRPTINEQQPIPSTRYPDSWEGSGCQPEGYRAADDHLRTTRREQHAIVDDHRKSLEQIFRSFDQLGPQSPKLIFGIDFTKSNEWTGKFSFNRRNLHDLGDAKNLYEQVISIVGRSLSTSTEKNPALCYGFGDASTNDKHVFGFYGDGRACRDTDEAVSRYREIRPRIKFAGPTSFKPIVEMAMTKVKQSGGHFHGLFIIADGQITRSVDTKPSELSTQEKETIDAIVRASKYPLSIFLVGVGDGPWSYRTKEFEYLIGHRDFDNFKFINFTEIMSRRGPPILKELEFAGIIWETIFSQYQKILELGLLWNESTWMHTERVPLTAPSSVTAISDDQACSICMSNIKDMAFGCGHRMCCICGEKMVDCPMCRAHINTRIKLYT